ncbi:hypothetical protein IAU59_004512 [Kwoniella sp. CBS 9459]
MTRTQARKRKDRQQTFDPVSSPGIERGIAPRASERRSIASAAARVDDDDLGLFDDPLHPSVSSASSSSPSSSPSSRTSDTSYARRVAARALVSECVICAEELGNILSSAEAEGKGGLGGGLALFSCDQPSCGALFCTNCAVKLVQQKLRESPYEPAKCCVCTRPWNLRPLQDQAKAYDADAYAELDIASDDGERKSRRRVRARVAEVEGPADVSVAQNGRAGRGRGRGRGVNGARGFQDHGTYIVEFELYGCLLTSTDLILRVNTMPAKKKAKTKKSGNQAPNAFTSTSQSVTTSTPASDTRQSQHEINKEGEYKAMGMEPQMEHHSECVICWEDLEEILASAERQAKGGLGGGLALWVCEQSSCGALYCIGCAVALTRKDLSGPPTDPSRVPNCCKCTRVWDAVGLQEQAKAFDGSIESLDLSTLTVPKAKPEPKKTLAMSSNDSFRASNAPPHSTSVPRPAPVLAAIGPPVWPRLGTAPIETLERRDTRRKSTAWLGQDTAVAAAAATLPTGKATTLNKIVATPDATFEKRITRSMASGSAGGNATGRDKGPGWSVANKTKSKGK